MTDYLGLSSEELGTIIGVLFVAAAFLARRVVQPLERSEHADPSPSEWLIMLREMRDELRRISDGVQLILENLRNKK